MAEQQQQQPQKRIVMCPRQLFGLYPGNYSLSGRWLGSSLPEGSQLQDKPALYWARLPIRQDLPLLAQPKLVVYNDKIVRHTAAKLYAKFYRTYYILTPQQKPVYKKALQSEDWQKSDSQTVVVPGYVYKWCGYIQQVGCGHRLTYDDSPYNVDQGYQVPLGIDKPSFVRSPAQQTYMQSKYRLVSSPSSIQPVYNDSNGYSSRYRHPDWPVKIIQFSLGQCCSDCQGIVGCDGYREIDLNGRQGQWVYGYQSMYKPGDGKYLYMYSYTPQLIDGITPWVGGGPQLVFVRSEQAKLYTSFGLPYVSYATQGARSTSGYSQVCSPLFYHKGQVFGPNGSSQKWYASIYYTQYKAQLNLLQSRGKVYTNSILYLQADLYMTFIGCCFIGIRGFLTGAYIVSTVNHSYYNSTTFASACLYMSTYKQKAVSTTLQIHTQDYDVGLYSIKQLKKPPKHVSKQRFQFQILQELPDVFIQTPDTAQSQPLYTIYKEKAYVWDIIAGSWSATTAYNGDRGFVCNAGTAQVDSDVQVLASGLTYQQAMFYQIKPGYRLLQNTNCLLQYPYVVKYTTRVESGGEAPA